MAQPEQTFEEWEHSAPAPEDVRIHLLSPDERAEQAAARGFDTQAIGEVRDAAGTWHEVALYGPEAMYRLEK